MVLKISYEAEEIRGDGVTRENFFPALLNKSLSS